MFEEAEMHLSIVLEGPESLEVCADRKLLASWPWLPARQLNAPGKPIGLGMGTEPKMLAPF